MNASIEYFVATDGDSWWSLIVDDELATGLMHSSRQHAEEELASLLETSYTGESK